MDTSAMFKISYGLYVLTAKCGPFSNGGIINTLQQVTNTPNRVSVTVNKTNYTNYMIRQSGKFNVSTIDESSDFDLFKNFGFVSGRWENKFHSFPSICAANGIPYVKKSCCAYLSCKVVKEIDLGTHTMFIAEVTDGEVLSDNAPMTYAYYHNVIKGKSPKNAPTYIAEEEGAATASEGKWQCGVCKYVYDGSDGPFEELPDDWKCPVCGQPKSVFEKID